MSSGRCARASSDQVSSKSDNSRPLELSMTGMSTRGNPACHGTVKRNSQQNHRPWKEAQRSENKRTHRFSDQDKLKNQWKKN